MYLLMVIGILAAVVWLVACCLPETSPAVSDETWGAFMLGTVLTAVILGSIWQVQTLYEKNAQIRQLQEQVFSPEDLNCKGEK